MTTISHEPSAVVRRRSWIDARDMWAALAIGSIWLAVLGSAAFAGDMHFQDAGGSSSTIPSVVVIAIFALLATVAVARHGFEPKER